MIWCNIIGHKWYYTEQEIEIDPTWHFLNKTELINIRYCKRCFKKQKVFFGYGVYNFKLGKYCNWTDIELTQAEKREKNLKKIGI